jgi:putative ABC transport system permease protein
MFIPLNYNLRSLRVRWQSTLVAVLGIAGSVGVFVAMLSLAHGFKATLVTSGSVENAIVRRGGATSEMDSALTIDSLHIIENAPGVARGPNGPLVTGETVVIAAFKMKGTDSDGSLQVRGVSAKALEVRPNVKIVEGRMFHPGLNELTIGSAVKKTYVGFDVGNTVKFGGGTWTIVGMFDSNGSAFDSEVWGDHTVLSEVYKRPTNIYSSVTARLDSPGALAKFKDALTADPRLNVQVERETDYYEKQSRVVTTLITVLGSLVAAVMAIGAIFGALNTMYSAVAERGREIATMRAIGYGAVAVITSFTFEMLCISVIGALIGCLAVLPLNGMMTGTMNWQTFSHLSFAFRITPALLIGGVVFALAMGMLGGVPPAIRASRARISVALREL